MYKKGLCFSMKIMVVLSVYGVLVEGTIFLVE